MTENEQQERPPTADPNSPATETQRRLLVDLGVDPAAAGDPRVTKAQAAEWIEDFRSTARRNEAARRAEGQTPAPAASVPPSPGPAMLPSPFVSADQLPPNPPKPRRAAAPQAELVPATAAPLVHPPSSFLVEPEINIEDAKRLWDAYNQFRTYILSDPACYDEIEGTKQMNRTGALRLSMPFGLSIEQVEFEEGPVQDEFEGKNDYSYRVRLRVSKGQRSVEGIGYCRLSEIPAKTKKGVDVPIGQRLHFAMTRAWTRASKRGIADILGGTEAE